MNISMVGIDHNIADVNIREKVALTKTKLTLVLRKIKDFYCVSGVVIISTCNRTEIWLNGYDDKASLEDMVCNVLNVNREFVKLYFVKRIGEDAVRHLFSLSSGVESKIIGEDQILTQVRQSADIARENKAIDSVLEKLFRLAVTAGKKVKTNVRISRVDSCIGVRIINRINNVFNEKCSCLVIGNGEIGKTCAKALINEGHRVYMTTRRYKSGSYSLVDGVIAIDYEDRYKYINLDVVISGTLSPHYTLTKDKIDKVVENNEKIFIDLAIPRDIEPSIGSINGITLYDIDSLSGDNREIYSEYTSKALSICSRYIEEFYDYYYTRDIKRSLYISRQKVGDII